MMGQIRYIRPHGVKLAWTKVESGDRVQLLHGILLQVFASLHFSLYFQTVDYNHTHVCVWTYCSTVTQNTHSMLCMNQVKSFLRSHEQIRNVTYLIKWKMLFDI